MADLDQSCATDADKYVRENFDRMTRAYLLSVFSDKLIDEHRNKPEGHHSEPLTRLLNWCHTRPLNEQYAVLQITDGRYQVVRLSGRPRVAPKRVDTEFHATVRDARHAAFLHHIKDLTGK
jgi:hypothetical protein